MEHPSRLGKGKREPCLRGVGFLLEIVVWCPYLFRQQELVRRMESRVFYLRQSSPEARGLGLEKGTVVWNRHMMALLSHSLYIIYCAGRLQ